MCSRNVLSIALMCAAVAAAAAQSDESKYQPGTIMAVKDHVDKDRSDSNVTTDSTKRYDISIKVGKTMYVVLYTPPPGKFGFQYAAGQQILVLVGSKTITYNDMLGNSRNVPILSRTAAR